MSISTTLVPPVGHSRPERTAIQLMIGQAFLFAAETAAIHQIGGRVSLMSLALIRAAGGLGLVLILARGSGLRIIRTQQLVPQLVCGLIGLLYLWVMVYSFSHLNFGDATAISYTHVAYIAVFSIFLLGEAVTPTRWAGAAVGFLGALLIAKPAFAEWNWAYLIVLAGTSLRGLGFVLYKRLQQKDSELTTMFYVNLVPFLANLPVLWFSGLPSGDALLWLPGVVALGPLGMYLGIVAVRKANVSMLGPFTFLRLVFGIAGGAIIFHELPDLFAGVGAVLILVGCVLSSPANLPSASGVMIACHTAWRRLGLTSRSYR